MPTTIEFKPKAVKGKMPSSAAPVYTAPASTWLFVKSITLVNKDSVDRTVNISTKDTGEDAINILVEDLPLGPRWMYRDGDLHVIEPGESIELFASAANVVHYRISGVEKIVTIT